MSAAGTARQSLLMVERDLRHWRREPWAPVFGIAFSADAASFSCSASSAVRPVRARKTSSSVGRRKVASSTSMPAASRSRIARVSTPSCDGTATLTRRSSLSTCAP